MCVQRCCTSLKFPRSSRFWDLLEVGEHLALLDVFVQGGGASDQGRAGGHEHRVAHEGGSSPASVHKLVVENCVQDFDGDFSGCRWFRPS